jgi:hypothetical protein
MSEKPRAKNPAPNERAEPLTYASSHEGPQTVTGSAVAPNTDSDATPPPKET